tara:strand:+ start:9668 stop:10123 length:456 start_codon:yes stop_codon:yes gene_type:complete
MTVTTLSHKDVSDFIRVSFGNPDGLLGAFTGKDPISQREQTVLTSEFDWPAGTRLYNRYLRFDDGSAALRLYHSPETKSALVLPLIMRRVQLDESPHRYGIWVAAHLTTDIDESCVNDRVDSFIKGSDESFVFSVASWMAAPSPQIILDLV